MKPKIKVIPNSKSSEVIEGELLTVRVKEAPEKGKANKSVIKLLEKHFKKGVKIISGEKSRRKIIEIV